MLILQQALIEAARPSAFLSLEETMLPPTSRWNSTTLPGLALCAAAALLLGCYKYVPATLSTVPTGSNIRAVLSTEAQADLRSRVGMDVDLLEGKLLESNDDEVWVSVRSVAASGMLDGTQPLYQRIDVPRQGVVRVDVRRLDRLRTYTLIGVAAGAAVFVAAQAFGEGGPGPEPPNGGPSDRVQGVLLRLPLRWW